MIAPPKRTRPDELEALIKEARARQLRRRLLGAAGIALAAALGVSAYTLVPGAAQSKGRGAEGRPQTSAASCAAAGGWRLAFDGLWPEPTGQHTAPLRVTRIGTKPCVLDGYPRIVLLDARGHALAFRYRHSGDLVISPHPPGVVHVRSHHSAFFMLNKYRCDIRASSVARWLRVRLPGFRGWLTLRLPRYPLIDYCPAEAPSGTIDISPLVGRLIQAVAQPG